MHRVALSCFLPFAAASHHRIGRTPLSLCSIISTPLATWYALALADRHSYVVLAAVGCWPRTAKTSTETLPKSYLTVSRVRICPARRGSEREGAGARGKPERTIPPPPARCPCPSPHVVVAVCGLRTVSLWSFVAPCCSELRASDDSDISYWSIQQFSKRRQDAWGV